MAIEVNDSRNKIIRNIHIKSAHVNRLQHSKYHKWRRCACNGIDVSGYRRRVLCADAACNTKLHKVVRGRSARMHDASRQLLSVPCSPACSCCAQGRAYHSRACRYSEHSGFTTSTATKPQTYMNGHFGTKPSR